MMLSESKNGTCFLREAHVLVFIVIWVIVLVMFFFYGGLKRLDKMIFVFNHTVAGTTDLYSVHGSVLNLVSSLYTVLKLLNISL